MFADVAARCRHAMRHYDHTHVIMRVAVASARRAMLSRVHAVYVYHARVPCAYAAIDAMLPTIIYATL